ncbi:hypothetical protein Lgee_0697 [Legionella geestiana]|uniref:Uncharacterized protein n=1 Tax=Legionella geestiana TaxID=45065 RepID=A0A0W0U368_9GAMM|nr:hypothetical protein [Legionella geestiana]KTD02368.1 hypothetical protein Lgee_0697 [Legionella geestiana]QBS12157.1 hypothetical protein E4T54_05040 [Legionella geestiana]QDQ40129.1 hypothetical protein E3226_006800 [Legionella geestiana]STX53114.1 Uncharacterised protein [Legionella geestiana]
MTIERALEETLHLQDGDILILETPYEDATMDDMFPLNMRRFTPAHSMLWIAGSDRPVAHAVREGYRQPGTRLTNLPEGRGMVFRFAGEEDVSQRAAAIMKNWSLSSKIRTREEHLAAWPPSFWQERHARDMRNFYSNPDAAVSGPAMPYPEPRAEDDLRNLMHNPELTVMGDEGLRRAIKFASRSNNSSPHAPSRGQRCTPVIIAAWQAAVLQPITRPGIKGENSFKDYKGKSFDEWADAVLIPGWRETPVGRQLLEARATGDYTLLFPAPFAVDQRYSTPGAFHRALKASNFINVGAFSSFKGRLECQNNHHTVVNEEASSTSRPGSSS